MDRKRFESPENILRPAPFWAINAKLTPQETARQFEDMRSVGLSGGFFHSRHGLTTDYLGDEWFECMEAALDSAEKTDGYVWLYDEDLWPSGNAGGQVAGMKDEYRATTLAPYLLQEGEGLPEENGDKVFRMAYSIRREGLKLTHHAIISKDEAADTSGERLVLYRIYEGKTGWWSGESYANLLHPEVTREFMRLTHEVYKDKLGKHFGKRVPGIFTDEPQIRFGGWGQPALPWYEGLPEAYNAWNDRNFWSDLPYLWFEGDESRKVRLLFHRSVLRQFFEAYSKPIYEWCEKEGIAHTGHFNAEDSFHGQITNHGGSIMAHYRYQQIPGIDILCRSAFSHLLTVKQVASAAKQLGRKHVLTEIFGVSRHTNTFQDFKWLGDYNLVLGANFLCPHLTLYSAKGRRKRDYPPNWNYQQTYWKELNPLNDYFTRVAAVTTSGEAKTEVLILHPIESGTAARRMALTTSQPWPGDDMNRAGELDREFRKLVEACFSAGYDCDLGDEWFLEDMGRVEGDRFHIGAMSYSVLIVPPSDTWRPNTLKLLKEFRAAGGTIIFTGRVPSEVDCEPANEEWRKLAYSCHVIPDSTVQVQAALGKLVKGTFTLKGQDGQPMAHTYLQHREDGDQDLIFVANSDREAAQSYRLSFTDGKSLPVAIWDALTGRQLPLVHIPGSPSEYSFALPPVGSILIVRGSGLGTPGVDSGKGDKECAGGCRLDNRPSEPVTSGMAQTLPDLSRGTVIPLTGPWTYELSEENVLVMDRISASVDGGATWWPEDMEHRVRQRLAAHFGIGPALEWQPWVAIRKGLGDGKGGRVILRYRFLSDTEPSGHVSVVLEDLRKGKLMVNGNPVDTAGADWHWDHDFGKVDISGSVRKGENVLEFAFDYDFLSEVEQAYIVGDFGVGLASPLQGDIIGRIDRITVGSWLDQGLPFYSGSVTYRIPVELPADAAGHLRMGDGGKSTWLRLKGASGIMFKARINGVEAGPLLWQPHTIDISGFVSPGPNIIELEVVGSRQNTFGPLHETYGDDDMWVGPDAFESEHKLREELSLFDYGILGGIELVRV